MNSAGIEANLDIQYTIGVATGVPTFFISVGNNFQDGALEGQSPRPSLPSPQCSPPLLGFLDIINFLLGESSPPQVLTTSYGQNENTISRNLAVYVAPPTAAAHALIGRLSTASCAMLTRSSVPAAPPSSSRPATAASRARKRPSPSLLLFHLYAHALTCSAAAAPSCPPSPPAAPCTSPTPPTHYPC